MKIRHVVIAGCAAAVVLAGAETLQWWRERPPAADGRTEVVCDVAYNADRLGQLDKPYIIERIVANGELSPVPAVVTASARYAEHLPSLVEPRAKASRERFDQLMRACRAAGWSAVNE